MAEVITTQSDLLTKAEAAAILRVAPITVHRMIREKRLGAYRIGARVFVGRQHVNDFLEHNERKPKEAA